MGGIVVRKSHVKLLKCSSSTRGENLAGVVCVYVNPPEGMCQSGVPHSPSNFTVSWHFLCRLTVGYCDRVVSFTFHLSTKALFKLRVLFHLRLSIDVRHDQILAWEVLVEWVNHEIGDGKRRGHSHNYIHTYNQCCRNSVYVYTIHGTNSNSCTRL